MKKMFRYFLAVHLLLILADRSIGQKYIEWQYVDTSYSLLSPVQELPDSTLIAALQPSLLYGPNYCKIVHISKDGKLIKEASLVTDSFYIYIQRIVSLDDGNKFMLLGSFKLKSPDSLSKNFFTLIIDKELNQSKIKLEWLNANSVIYNISYYKIEKDTILAALNVTNGQFGPSDQDIYLKMDKEGNIISKQYHTGFICLSIIPSATGYDCYSTFIKKFNKNFEFVSESLVPNFYIGGSNQNYGVRISPNTILGGGGHPVSPNIPAAGAAVIYFFDNNYNVKKYAYITEDNPSPVPINVFDITPDSSIYLCNYESVGTAFASFKLAKFGMDFKKKWEIHHKDDPNFRYRLWNMEATNDNGVILYGIWYRQPDWKPMAGMLKINENGNLVWTYNLPSTAFQTITCSPNPASDMVKISVHGISGTADLRIFDMAGRNVYVQSGLHDGDNTIDLTGLPSGTYIYKLYQGSRQIGQGQVVRM